MIGRILKKLEKLKLRYELKVFSRTLKRYGIEFYYKDKLGILSKRTYSDNFDYIFNTKNSCDATPFMVSLNGKLGNPKVSIDVGANIGITTIWMARQSQIVYAFEPEESNVKRLRDNLSVNNINNVELIPKAVTSQSGKASLNIFESYGHHSLSPVHLTKPLDVLEVEAITLDDFCQKNNIEQVDLLKIDVEGFEIEVLKGARKLLKNKKIGFIIFEHSKILFEKQKRDPKEVILFLQQFNYNIYLLNGTAIELDNIGNLKQEDLYAI